MKRNCSLPLWLLSGKEIRKRSIENERNNYLLSGKEFRNARRR
jgi:hypothetical protein